jgi:DNA-directed RNA polymerase specialized sigma24 family protein
MKRELEQANYSLSEEEGNDEDKRDYIGIIETAYEQSENRITLVNLLKKNWNKLSKREKEVLTLKLFDFKNIEIANLFCIHKRNINTYLDNAYEKIRKSVG